MASVTRSVIALMLVALQLVLAGWGPCASAPQDGAGSVVTLAAEALASEHAHHAPPVAPASDGGSSETGHGTEPCPMMGTCGPTGIHQPAVVRLDAGGAHPPVRMPDAAAPEFTPLSPEPPPPRG